MCAILQNPHKILYSQLQTFIVGHKFVMFRMFTLILLFHINVARQMHRRPVSLR